MTTRPSSLYPLLVACGGRPGSEARMPKRKKSERKPIRDGEENGPPAIRGGRSASRTTSLPSITGAAFWALMDRWKIPDELAVRLIAGPPLTGTRKRPRFRLTGEQVEKFNLLREIDRHAVNIF